MKNITIALLSTLIATTVFAQTNKHNNSFDAKADAPTNMVCKLKNDKLNTCIDVSSLQTNNSPKPASKTKEVYRVQQPNGIWAYSDNKTSDSEILDLTSEKMTRNISIINHK